MGPYTKTEMADGWKVTEGDGNVIAEVETERLADVLMDALVNGVEDIPEFNAGVPYGEDESGEENSFPQEKVYRLDVPAYVTVYVRAQSPEDALEKAKGLKHSTLGVTGSPDLPVWEGDPHDLDAPATFLSEVGTLHEADDETLVEEFDD